MAAAALCGLLARTLPLVLLPHISFRPGGLRGIPAADEAEQTYRRRLDQLCRAHNSSSELPAPAQPSGSTLPDDDASLRIPQSLLRGSYDEAMARAKRENKILMVVLESEVHEHTSRFRTETLLNPHLDKLLAQEDILLWAADLSSRDATQVAQLLQSTMFPFVAFISAQPKVNSSSGARTRMAVLSRHEGLGAVGLATLSEHIRTVLVPRVGGYLSRLQREQAVRSQHPVPTTSRAHPRPHPHPHPASAPPPTREQQRYFAWRKWALQADDPRLPRDVDRSDPNTVAFVVRYASGHSTVVYLPQGAPVEALFAAVELDAPAPYDGPRPPASEAPQVTEAGEEPRWPQYNFSFILTGAFPRRSFSPDEDLSQPISSSGLLDPEESHRPIRATLAVEGCPGWHTGSYA